MSLEIGSAAVMLNGYLPHFAQFNVPEKTDYLGHTYQAVSDKFKVLSELTTLTDSLHYVSQFTIAAATVVTRGTLFRGFCRLTELNSYIDFIRTYGDIGYFVKGEVLDDLRHSHFAGIISGSLFLSSSLGSCMNVMDHFSLMNVSAIAKSISNASLFGIAPFRMISKLALSEFCCFAATGGFLFGSIDNFMKIQDGDLATSRIAQLAYCISTLALQLFLITGEALVVAQIAVPVAGALAMVSSGFGAWWIWQSAKERS